MANAQHKLKDLSPMHDDIADELESVSRYALRRCRDFDDGKIELDGLHFVDGTLCAKLDIAVDEIRDLRARLEAVRKAVT